MNDIQFILTGGTIEKSYNPVTEKPEINPQSIIKDYLKIKIKPYFPAHFEQVCLLDSVNITDEVRQDILEIVQKTKHQKIIIIHGTSTMTITAEYLSRHLKDNEKTIILTGSMIPLQEFAMSDAGFNLGFAVSEVNSAPSGVYVCMNGHRFATGAVRKDEQIGRFEKI